MKNQWNEKGFTLVETLGVLAILAIIMLIAIPRLSVSNEKSATAYYENLEKLILISARDYYSDHRSLYPAQLNATNRVYVDQLVKLKYIEQPKSTRKNNCTGYVEVKKENSMVFKTCLKCDDYESKTECDFTTVVGGQKYKYIYLEQVEYTVVKGNPFTPPVAQLRYGTTSDYEVLRNDIGATPGYVDTSVVGDHTLTYTAPDATTLQITVHVVNG